MKSNFRKEMLESTVRLIIEETVRYTATRILNVSTLGQKDMFDRHISFYMGPEGLHKFIKMLTIGYLENDRDFENFLEQELELARDFMLSEKRKKK